MEQFMVMGFQEYLYRPNSIAFIEWPEVIEPLLKDKTCRINLDYAGEDVRIIKYDINF
jgi:tRNA A37 threonylcarbamoyladenosine biosynthesis protein TsaE